MNPYARRVLAEFLGTGLLVAVVVGSGIAATRLTPDAGLRLLINSTTTALGLGVLILLFGPASGSHFNPLVTVADWALSRTTDVPTAAGVVAAQVIGALGGAVLADAMFAAPPIALSTDHRDGAHLLLAEVVATAGLLLLVVGLTRTRRTQHAAVAVGAYIGAAYWFTASTSFANPAVTVGRMITDSYAGIAPSSGLAFIAAQAVGAVIGTGLAVALFPIGADDRSVADHVVLEPAPRQAS